MMYASPMNKVYRVFTGAPSATWTRKPTTTSWKTVSSRDVGLLLPPATIEQASRRISLVYQNVLFDDNDEEQNEEEESQNSSVSSSHSGYSGVNDLSNLQDTYDVDETVDETTMFTESSSISHFPSFNFSLNSLASLSSIIRSRKPGLASCKVTLLLGVLEVDGPTRVTVKTGPYAGAELGLLKLIVGDEMGAVCKITAWRETAEMWGGSQGEPGLKRGDIGLFENVMVPALPRKEDAFREAVGKLQLTASPNLRSQAQICYRTLPSAREDRKLRPDLRLADTLPCMRKVAEVVTWMEQMAGIAVVDQ